MRKAKKTWTTPRLKRLESTKELLELFAGQLPDEDQPAEVRLKRTG